MRSRAPAPEAATLIAVIVSAAVLGGCVEFVAPALAERGAPALLYLEVRMVAPDSISIDGTLTPGIDEDGFLRELGARPLEVADSTIRPAHVAEDGSITYEARIPFAATDEVRVRAPEVLDVDAAAPILDWPAIVRTDGDTVTTEPDGSLVLHTALTRVADPPADLVQWSLRLEGHGGAITITATGPPPVPIIIPAHLLPPDDDGELSARLVFYQSARVEPPPGDYLALLVVDTRAFWTVVAPTAKGERSTDQSGGERE